MKKTQTISTEDILLTLCNSVGNVLGSATGCDITFSPMIQKIHKTSLRPDIGCFVLFDGGFSGLVVINFSAEAAIELYQNYMTNMGIPESELANQHTSDEVSNVMGELMNQILGDFTGKIGKELQTSINQNQPKMLTINKQVNVSIDTSLDRPQSRRVSFFTAKHNIFYLELAMDKTEFMKLHEFEAETDDLDPDAIIDKMNNDAKSADEKTPPPPADNDIDDDFLSQLGL
ncbi:MAG: CheY-specific phosphatase CheX [Phenylobacterium sp.]|jgi:CheY-specific phosphatase CheX